MMSNWNWSEAVQYLLLNGGTVGALLHYDWFTMVPSPDRVVEWVLGAMVMLTLILLNGAKAYYMITDKRRERRERKRK